MNGREDDAQALGVEHHGDAGDTCQVRQEICMPFPRQTRGCPGRLVDWACRDAVQPSRKSISRRRLNGVECSPPPLRRLDARAEREAFGSRRPV